MIPHASTDFFPDARHSEFPVCTQVTLCHGVCDSRCVSCPIGQLLFGDAREDVHLELNSGSPRFMAMEVFRRVCDEVALYKHAWLRLHGRGEPLLHPGFVDMVAYAKRAGVRIVQAFTNAIRLDEATAAGILQAGLDVLECSIHGHDRTYEQLMRNGKGEHVRQNVLRFRALRDRMGVATRLVVSAVDQPGFQIEKEAHRGFWSQVADQVIYRPHHSWGGRVGGVCGAVPANRHPCPQLWTRCTIGPSGRVLACFNSWSERPEEVLGTLHDGEGGTIGAIWRSPRFERIRRDHARGRYSLPCCRDCKDWSGSSWGENSYEHLLQRKLHLRGQDARAD